MYYQYLILVRQTYFKMLISALLCFLIIIKCNYCFNIDTKFPIVYADASQYLNLKPTNKSAYFGYSLVLYPGDERNAPWVLTGAPRGQNPALPFENPGGCFKCRIKEKCTVEEIPKENSLPYNNPNERLILTDAWLGASMDISYNHDRIVTCGYRRIDRRKTSPTSEDYYIRGLCYWFHANDNTTQPLSPLYEQGKSIYTSSSPSRTTYFYNYAQGQAGFSVHLPDVVVEKTQLLLGAPGVYNWAGTSILYKDDNTADPAANRQHVKKRYAAVNEFHFKNVANSITTTETYVYDLFGYSSTSGYFYGNKNLYYASGAPKSSSYHGKVLVYQFDTETDKALKVREFRNGAQFGEYFGAALAAGDINNDGFDDLIVGAPFHKVEKYNEGKVYVFLGGKKSLSNDAISVTGEQSNGQFGICVQYLGRINSDKYGAIAVAAPYADEGRGVVYLYRGNGNGLDTIPSQRIIGKNVYPKIQGFGLSISRAADIDFNRCPDVAIGAPLSGHVVLLRTRPVVTIYQSLNSSIRRLNSADMSFDVQACFAFKINQAKANVTIRRIITVDEELGRARLKNIKNIEPKQLLPGPNCENISVTINPDADRLVPIKVLLTHELISEEQGQNVIYVSDNVAGTDHFCPTCPIYDKYNPSSLSTLELHFNLGCKSDICESSLELIPKITNIENDGSFILGSKDYLTLQIRVNNSGEKAYSTEVEIILPEFVDFRSTPPACTTTNTSCVKCNVDNPLDEMSEKMVTLDLDVTKINNVGYEGFLNIKVKVSTISKNNGDNEKLLMVEIKREADVTISGKSEEQYSYQNIDDAKPNLFSQRYQVEKFGISPLNEILIEIEIPHRIKTKDKTIDFLSLYPPGGNRVDQTIICTSNFTYIIENVITEDGGNNEKNPKKRLKRQAMSNVNKESESDTFSINCDVHEVICSKIRCTSAFVESSQIANIELKMLFDISSLKDILDKKRIIQFRTRGSVVVKSPANFNQSGNLPDTVEVTSLFMGADEKTVALWIIIVSAIAGLLLLLLMTIGLIKVGFFKRKTKEELEQLKKKIEDHEADDIINEEEN